ncbi:MAG TPA: S46 family peptidase [Polyangia bacterium]|nr:S46 family peptidase [Polyangia bacterium]
MRTRYLLLSALLVPLGAVRADEGMWTYNNFPKDKFKARYGYVPDDKWLEHMRLSSARLAGGCSGSFVSEGGLVMTNHHCAHSCIQQLSTPDKDFIKSGFYAKRPEDEVKCPEIEVNQLVEITDVTDRISRATQGLAADKYNAAQRAEMARIEKECAQADPGAKAGPGDKADKIRCDVVSLYHGGVYNLYKYRRFQDVRLVFAPELSIASFGGDPDNFNFPRYDLDMAFLRVYDDGKPARMSQYLRWSPAGAKEGDVTFISGHPGGTDRQLTVAELEYHRDVMLPDRLLAMAQVRGELTQFMMRGPEEHRMAESDLFIVENGYKAARGRWETLLDKSFFASKVMAENELRAAIARDPEKQSRYGGAWDAIARALDEQKKLRKRLAFIERGSLAGGSELYQLARGLVRAGEELAKPNDKRFREFRDSALPAIKQGLFSSAPIYDQLEIQRLRLGLTRLREELGTDDPFVQKVLGKDSPEGLARRLVEGTKLKDVALRKQLFEGGQQAIDASNDPLIQFVKMMDPEARAVRKQFEDNIDSVLKKNHELIAQAHFAVEGTNTYPDATFTLRLSYGQVKGYEENGRMVKPFTNLAGAFERNTGKPPFDLPPSWLAAKNKLDLNTPFNFCTTNDIIGGNSGSPVVDRDGRVVGVVFDGNIQSLGGNYGYDISQNRAVVLASQAILQALDRIYGAERVSRELRGGH